MKIMNTVVKLGGPLSTKALRKVDAYSALSPTAMEAVDLDQVS